MMKPGERTSAPIPAPDGAYLDAAFLCVVLTVPFFYLLLPSFLPKAAAEILSIRLLVPPLAVLLITSMVSLLCSPEIPAKRKFGIQAGRPFPWKAVISYWLFLYVFLILVSGAVKALANRFGLSLPEQDAVQLLACSDVTGKALIIFSSILIAPLTEEFIFRHIFFSCAAYRIGGGPASVLTAVLFSALHANLLQAPSLFFMSLILQAVYVKTGRLTVPVLIHALFNTVSVILILLIHVRT